MLHGAAQLQPPADQAKALGEQVGKLSARMRLPKVALLSATQLCRSWLDASFWPG